MTDLISWIATVATVIATFMTASNLGARITGYGFAVFLIGSLPWSEARIESDRVVVELSRQGFERLETLERDRWPSR